ncbi:hypothetical protein M0R04_06160 [Candidatus Dojkabacteria bacterium]|jgi:hypothetical protein|nr:hypothetical protein [Candidatus Dojkabacteria bacterium]
MPNMLKNVTQDEYNKISTEYFEEIGMSDSVKYYHFFSNVQKEVEKILFEKFAKEGIKLIRDLKEEDEQTKSFPQTAMRYKLVFASDPTNTMAVNKVLNMTTLIKEIRLVDPDMSAHIPDVKIVIPEYLTKKIEEVTDKVVRSFKIILKNRLSNIRKKLIKEGIKYDEADNAFISNSFKVGNK